MLDIFNTLLRVSFCPFPLKTIEFQSRRQLLFWWLSLILSILGFRSHQSKQQYSLFLVQSPTLNAQTFEFLTEYLEYLMRSFHYAPVYLLEFVYLTTPPTAQDLRKPFLFNIKESWFTQVQLNIWSINQGYFYQIYDALSLFTSC